MIRRHTSPSHYHLITQTDHALLSFHLAQHLGNHSFTPPDSSTLIAIAHHDAGWPLHDDSPTLNADHLPRDVFESTPDLSFPIWTASADRAQQIHPYAGLLVSLHSLSLSVFATSSAPSKHESFNLSNQKTLFALNQFQHQEFERQEHLRKQLNLRTDLPLLHGLSPAASDPAEDLLRFHFRLLQAMDLLSLALCCTTPPAPTTQDVHPHPGSPPIKLALTRPTATHLQVHPWPFNQPHLHFQIPSLLLPACPYSTLEQFHSAYHSAPTQILYLTLSPPP